MNGYQAKKYAGGDLEVYKKTLSLTDEQKDVIVGTLLGDSTMGLRQQKKLYSIKFEQKGESKAYINHLYEIMEPYVGTPPAKNFCRKKTSFFKSDGIKSFWFRTYRHDHFIFYFNLFYTIEVKNGKKVAVKIVPKNIHKLLNARVLAYWFMDDGTLTGYGANYYLNTQGFKKHEIERLCDALKTCFGIKSAIHKDKERWRIYINAESNDLFESLIMPYLQPTFFYKLRQKP